MQEMITLDVFDRNGEFLGIKGFYANAGQSLNKWWVQFKDEEKELAFIVNQPADFQNNNKMALLSKPQKRYCLSLTQNNLIPFSVYFAVRHAMKATWLNDRDQFLYPNDKWQEDNEFQNDCLAFSLFHPQNRIQSKEGINHFIPFSEGEVGAKEAFESHFMQEFIKGKIYHTEPLGKVSQKEGFDDESFYNKTRSFIPDKPLNFSEEAKAVFEKGLNLWKYYHQSDNDNPNASLYDIRMHFQGRNEKGDMQNIKKCKNEDYKGLYYALSEVLQNLAQKITPKIYEYGFLRQ